MWDLVSYFLRVPKAYAATTLKLVLHPVAFGEECYLRSYDHGFLQESASYLFQSVLVSYSVFVFITWFFLSTDIDLEERWFVFATLGYATTSAVPLIIGVWHLRINRDLRHVTAVALVLTGFFLAFDMAGKAFWIVLDSIEKNTDSLGYTSELEGKVVANRSNVVVLAFLPVFLCATVYRYIIAKHAFQTQVHRIMCAEIAGVVVGIALFWIVIATSAWLYGTLAE